MQNESDNQSEINRGEDTSAGSGNGAEEKPAPSTVPDAPVLLVSSSSSSLLATSKNRVCSQNNNNNNGNNDRNSTNGNSNVTQPHLPLSASASLSNSTTIKASAIGGGGRHAKRGSTSMEAKAAATPKRNINKVNRKGKRQHLLSVLNRPCDHHSFLTEVTDVQQMEQGLLQLLDDFHSGKLQAFGKDCSFQKMDHIREQQERLARLHFDLGSKQEAYGTLTDEGQAVAKENLSKLMNQLQELSLAIEQLQSSTSSGSLQTEV